MVARRGKERSIGRGGGKERREGWTGWIRRLAAIDFSRQTRGLFVPLLVLVLPSSVPLALPLSLFPWHSRPRVSGPSPPPSFPFSLARSLFALLLVNALPPFDSRSVLSLSLFLLFSPYSPFAFEDLSLFFLVLLV